MKEQTMTDRKLICITTDYKERCWLDPLQVGDDVVLLVESSYLMSFGIPQEIVDLHIEDNKGWHAAWRDFITPADRPFMCSSEHILPGGRQFFPLAKLESRPQGKMYILDQTKTTDHNLEKCGGLAACDRLAFVQYGTYRMGEMSIEEHTRRNTYYWASYFWEFSIESILNSLVSRAMKSDRSVRKGKDDKIHECKGLAFLHNASIDIKEIQMVKRHHYDGMETRYWDVYNYVHDEIQIPEVLCAIIADYDDFMLIVTI